MSSKQCVLAVFAVFPNLVGSQRAKYRAKIKNKKMPSRQFIELPPFQFLGSYAKKSQNEKSYKFGDVVFGSFGEIFSKFIVMDESTIPF
jgi:hypothetical protein